MSQAIPVGTRVWVRLNKPTTRVTEYSGTVLRQNPYETTNYLVRLDITGRTVVVNDSMLSLMQDNE